MTKLKPCPFCGNNDLKDMDIETTGRQSLHIKNKVKSCFVHCWECGANGAVASTENKAIEAWNKRSQIIKPIINDCSVCRKSYKNDPDYCEIYAEGIRVVQECECFNPDRKKCVVCPKGETE